MFKLERQVVQRPCKASPALFVAVIGRKMAFDLHGVVKHATNTDQIRANSAIKQKMPRQADEAIFISGSVAAVTKMIAAYALPYFRAPNASSPPKICSQVAQRSHQQPLVTQTGLRPIPLLGPSENIDDVALRRL